jgi:hypothetical protein
MNSTNRAGSAWNDQEIDLIIADYFAMLSLELTGRKYNKAQHNRNLQQLIGRSEGSIEFKHQNVSAVLHQLGLPWINGYKPMPNFQGALIQGVERYLVRCPDPLPTVSEVAPAGPADGLLFEPPPGLSDSVPDEPRIRRLVRKFNYALRDEQNRALGKQGEERVLNFERLRLERCDRPDLARKVRWVSEEDGDGAGYDILSFDPRGCERLLEVKTTAGHQRASFFLSENERALSEEEPDRFRLVRVYDFMRQPRAFELAPPLADAVRLQAVNYRASF